MVDSLISERVCVLERRDIPLPIDTNTMQTLPWLAVGCKQWWGHYISSPSKSADTIQPAGIDLVFRRPQPVRQTGCHTGKPQPHRLVQYSETTATQTGAIQWDLNQTERTRRNTVKPQPDGLGTTVNVNQMEWVSYSRTTSRQSRHHTVKRQPVRLGVIQWIHNQTD